MDHPVPYLRSVYSVELPTAITVLTSPLSCFPSQHCTHPPLPLPLTGHLPHKCYASSPSPPSSQRGVSPFITIISPANTRPTKHSHPSREDIHPYSVMSRLCLSFKEDIHPCSVMPTLCQSSREEGHPLQLYVNKRMIC